MCNCEENKNNCFESECEETKACDKDFSTSCIFYRLENQENSKLYTINVENGTPLNTVLELFDAKLNLIETPNFNAFTIPYLKSKGVVTNIRNFSELVSLELGRINAKTILTEDELNTTKTNVQLNTQSIYNLNYPQITDSALSGFTVFSDLKTVIQKLSDKVATISNTTITSPTINQVETSTIKFTLSGSLNHTLSAVTKVSSLANNMIQVMPDGLFVSSVSIPNQFQTLGINGNILTLTNGGAVTLPPSTLTLTGTTLGIVGSTTTVNLASVLNNSQQVITANNTTSATITPTGTLGHTLSVDVIRSNDAGNILEKRNTGLYVPSTQAQAVLDEINNSAANSTLKNTFCSIQNSTCKPPYRFYIKNTSNGSINFTYVHKDSGSQMVVLAANASTTLFGVERITYALLDDVDVKFLGV